jgi:hypothetical protein
MIGTKNKQIKKTPVKILYGKMKKKTLFFLRFLFCDISQFGPKTLNFWK